MNVQNEYNNWLSGHGLAVVCWEYNAHSERLFLKYVFSHDVVDCLTE